ncbi:MAG: type II toxin-antitoxin system VapC family toxin [bacterium]
MVIDSDIIIKHLRSKDKTNTKFTFAALKYKLHTTVISEFEIYVGAMTQKQIHSADQLFRLVNILDLNAGCGKEAGQMLMKFRKQGKQVDWRDTLIAGICIYHSLPLLSDNVKHFEKFEKLKLIHI